MTSPDAIADHALLSVSRWQRETSQERGNRLLYRDQARRWEANDNQSLTDWQRRNEIVRGEMEAAQSTQGQS